VRGELMAEQAAVRPGDETLVDLGADGRRPLPTITEPPVCMCRPHR
jgi:hypothetical protein